MSLLDFIKIKNQERDIPNQSLYNYSILCCYNEVFQQFNDEAYFLVKDEKYKTELIVNEYKFPA